MKNLKKISAVVLALALMLTMISFTAFADGEVEFTFKVTDKAGNAISTVKPGSTVYVNVYLTAGNYKSAGVSFNFPDGSTVTKDAIETSANEVTVKSFVALDWTSEITVEEGVAVAVVPITIDKNATEGTLDLIAYRDAAYYVDSSNYGVPEFDTVAVDVVFPKVEFTFAVTDGVGNEVTTVKAGSTVYVNVYLTEGTYGSAGVAFNFPAGSIVDKDTIETSAKQVAVKSFVSLDWTSEITVEEGVAIGVVPITINTDAEEGILDLIVYKDSGYYINSSRYGAPEFETVTINVSKPWAITGFVALDDVNASLGTAKADLVLPAAVTATGEGGKSEVRAVTWASETYVDGAEAVPGTYTFTGTIVEDDSKLGIIGDVKPTVNVVVAPIAYSEAIALEGEIMEVADTVPTDDDMATTLPTTYEVTGTSAGVEFTDTINITWAETATSKSADFAGVAGETATFTATAVTVAKGRFTVDAATVTGVVTVKPPVTYVVGDVTGDGEVKKLDWQLVLAYVNENYSTELPEGLDFETSVAAHAADANCDGQIKKLDWQLILAYVIEDDVENVGETRIMY